jgi:hypothetical protein
MENEWRQQELYKAMMVLPVEGLKTLCLINGGAAVATLTYVGNLASKTPAGSLPDVRPAIICYCAGLAAAAATFLISYLVQLAASDSLHSASGAPVIPLRPRPLIWIGCLMAVFALVAFIAGSILAADALAP